MKPAVRSLGMILTLLLAIGLAAIGFMRHVPGPEDGRLAFLAQMGGSLADICDDSGRANPEKAMSLECPACHLVGTVVLPDTFPTLRQADLRFVAVVVAPRESRALRQVRDPALGLRGPPVALI